MKLFNITSIGILAILSLASCEMKNELTGNTSPKTEMGILELGVSVKQPVSQTRAGVVTNSFPVIITGASTEVSDVKKEYATVEDMPSSVSLPVGKYTVTSHTPGKLEKKMGAPYYGGSTTMSITKGITTSTSVVCKMQNSRIQIKYGDDFQSSFKSWTITVDDGSNTALSFDETEVAPSAIYWNFDDSSVTAITVNIRAVTTEGNTVSESRTFKKSDASNKYEDENEFFNGGDALDINMGTVSSSTGSVSGITIKAFITFENESESVEIPVGGEEEPGGGEEGGGDNPGENPGDGPTLKLPKDVILKAYEMSDLPSADALITTSAGIKEMFVKITAGNEGFYEALKEFQTRSDEDGGAIDFINGVNLVNNTKIDDLFTSLNKEVKTPVSNDIEYSFPIGAFFSLLTITGSSENPHEFAITVVDNNNNETKGVFKVTITE
ncbi:DUF4493 domain-containing protein [Bacteroides sp.]|uniref:DUF4493 domain-containing protein n=1 Tax=Bacteroides sp. TaxID=29523 RepID=UPI002623B3C8|nr:DUF4493 domain-containing protein [Bacteroides sp.]